MPRIACGPATGRYSARRSPRTVADPAEVDDELTELLAALAS